MDDGYSKEMEKETNIPSLFDRPRVQKSTKLDSTSVKRKSNKRQGRLGIKMFDNSAQTQKPRKLITLEEFFHRKFFQNNLAEAVHTVSRCEIQDEKGGC